MRSSAAPRVDSGLAPAYAAARARLGLVATLFALAAIGWVWAAREMQGMDAGPWTSLGTLGWFLTIWVVMMAAMMLPSVAPTIALYAKVTKKRSPLSPWLFAAGYLLTWAGAGLVAYAVGVLATAASGEALSWDRWGRTFVLTSRDGGSPSRRSGRREQVRRQPLLHDCGVGFDDIGDQGPPPVIPP